MNWEPCGLQPMLCGHCSIGKDDTLDDTVHLLVAIKCKLMCFYTWRAGCKSNFKAISRIDSGNQCLKELKSCVTSHISCKQTYNFDS